MSSSPGCSVAADSQFEVSSYYSVATVSDLICFSMGAAVGLSLVATLGLVLYLSVSEYLVFRMREVVSCLQISELGFPLVDGPSYWIWPRS